MSCFVCGQCSPASTSTEKEGSQPRPLRNFTSVFDFLLNFGVIDHGVVVSEASYLCDACLLVVEASDGLLSDLRRNVADLKEKHAVRGSGRVVFVNSPQVFPAPSVLDVVKNQLLLVPTMVLAQKAQKPSPISDHAYVVAASSCDRRQKPNQVLPKIAPRVIPSCESEDEEPCPEESVSVKMEVEEDDYDEHFLAHMPEVKVEFEEGEEDWEDVHAETAPAEPEVEMDPEVRAANAEKDLRRKAAIPQGPVKVTQSVPCPWCKRPVRSSLDDRFAHLVSFHTGGKRGGDIRCWDCGMSFFTDGDLQLHLAQHRKFLRDHVTCIHCRKDVLFDLFVRHVERAHPAGLARTKKERIDSSVTVLTCSLCHFWCTERERWYLHYLQAHGAELRCWFCRVVFSSRVALNIHLRKDHLKEYLVKCSACEKEFSTWKQFNCHVGKHPGEVNVDELEHPCSYCGLRLRYTQLRKHVEETHREVTPKSDKLWDTFVLSRKFQEKESRKLQKAEAKRAARTAEASDTSEDSADDEDETSGEDRIGFTGIRIERGRKRRATQKHALTEEELAKKTEQSKSCHGRSHAILVKQVHLENWLHRIARASSMTGLLRITGQEIQKQRRIDGAPCPICQKTLGTKKSLKAAMFRHYGEEHAIQGGKRCWDCGMYFASDADLEGHLDEHRSENRKRVVCIHCRKIFESPNFKEHVLRCHPDGLARTRAERAAAGVIAIRCKECTYWAATEAQFYLHMARAHERMAAWCDLCDEEFPNPGRFTYHMKTHHAEDVLCPTCGEKFSPIGLKRHSLICQQPMEKVRCPECDKELSKKSLAHHLAAVHNIGNKKKKNFKLVVCAECRYKAYGQPHFAAHMKTSHGVELPGLKEYTCKLCQEVFHHNREFTAHLRRDHGVLTLKLLETGLVCNLCGERAPERAPFLQHLSYVHNLDIGTTKFMDYVVVSEEKSVD